MENNRSLKNTLNNLQKNMNPQKKVIILVSISIILLSLVVTGVLYFRGQSSEGDEKTSLENTNENDSLEYELSNKQKIKDLDNGWATFLFRNGVNDMNNRKIFTYEFTITAPSDIEILYGYESSNAEYSSIEMFEIIGESFILHIGILPAIISFEYEISESIGESGYFSKIWRVENIDDNIPFYTNDYSLDTSKCGSSQNTPCGSGTLSINLEDDGDLYSTNFWAECESDSSDYSICDRIVKELEVKLSVEKF